MATRRWAYCRAGAVVFVCIRSLTCSPIACWLWMMLGRRELPYDDALDIVLQHHGGRLHLKDCEDAWVLVRASFCR